MALLSQKYVYILVYEKQGYLKRFVYSRFNYNNLLDVFRAFLRNMLFMITSVILELCSPNE